MGYSLSAGDNKNRTCTPGMVVNTGLCSGGTYANSNSSLKVTLHPPVGADAEGFCSDFGAVFPSYGISVKGTGQSCSSSLPPAGCFSEVGYPQAGTPQNLQ